MAKTTVCWGRRCPSILFRRLTLNATRESRTFGHDARGARDRVSKIEVRDSRDERRFVDSATERGDRIENACIRRPDDVEAHQEGVGHGERRTQLGERIE